MRKTVKNSKGQTLIIVHGDSTRDIKDDVIYLSGLRDWKKTVRRPAEWKAKFKLSFLVNRRNLGKFEDTSGKDIFYFCINTKRANCIQLRDGVVSSVKVFINSGQLDSNFLEPIERLFTTV